MCRVACKASVCVCRCVCVSGWAPGERDASGFNDSLCNNTLEVIITNTMQVTTFDPTTPPAPYTHTHLSLCKRRETEKELRSQTAEVQRARGLQSQQLDNSSNTEQLINSAASRGEKNVKSVKKKEKARGTIRRLIALMDCADL